MNALQNFRRCRNGFTLIEIIVVIAIVALLSALLLPTVNSSIKKVRQTQSLANMKSITMAMITYAADHEMSIPSDVGSPRPPTWDIQILPYMGFDFAATFDNARRDLTASDGSPISLISIYRCPLDTRKAGKGIFPRSYGASGVAIAPTDSWLGGIPGRKLGEGIRLNLIKDLSRFVLLCRTPLDWENSTNVVGQGAMLATNGPNPNSPNDPDWKIFGGKTPYAFADGHTALLTPAEAKEVDPRKWNYGM
jgi:prepilin-type N-terminal cleavage/methylation domain-containing protein/prepilin-type processing-associated H-X9-DG protein